MRWTLALAFGLLGCHTENPEFDPANDTGSGPSSSTTPPGTGAGAADTGTTASVDPTGASTTDTTIADTTVTDTNTSGAPVDECPGVDELSAESLRGIWWLCEHGINGQPPADGCVTLDDDGIWLAAGDEVSKIEWPRAPMMDDCVGPTGRCFYCADPDPEAVGPVWGSWFPALTGKGAVDMLVFEERTSCESTLRWEPVPGQPYVKVEPIGGGTGDGCNLIGEGEPSIPSSGPWFMRSLQD